VCHVGFVWRVRPATYTCSTAVYRRIGRRGAPFRRYRTTFYDTCRPLSSLRFQSILVGVACCSCARFLCRCCCACPALCVCVCVLLPAGPVRTPRLPRAQRRTRRPKPRAAALPPGSSFGACKGMAVRSVGGGVLVCVPSRHQWFNGRALQARAPGRPYSRYSRTAWSPAADAGPPAAPAPSLPGDTQLPVAPTLQLIRFCLSLLRLLYLLLLLGVPLPPRLRLAVAAAALCCIPRPGVGQQSGQSPLHFIHAQPPAAAIPCGTAVRHSRAAQRTARCAASCTAQVRALRLWGAVAWGHPLFGCSGARVIVTLPVVPVMTGCSRARCATAVRHLRPGNGCTHTSSAAVCFHTHHHHRLRRPCRCRHHCALVQPRQAR
jgi:hypothetical protein